MPTRILALTAIEGTETETSKTTQTDAARGKPLPAPASRPSVHMLALLYSQSLTARIKRIPFAATPGLGIMFGF